MNGEQLISIFESILIVIILSLTTLIVIWVKHKKFKIKTSIRLQICLFCDII